MRKFKPRFGKEVNLDNPKTYSHLPKTCNELDDLMFKEIGRTIAYMDYFPTQKKLFPKKKRKIKKVQLSMGDNRKFDINNVGYYQRLRVYKLIKNFAENRRRNYDNKMWYKEQVFLLQDETENMC